MTSLNKALHNIAHGFDTDPWCPQMEPCDIERQEETDKFLDDEDEQEKQEWWTQQNQDDDAIAMSCADMEVL